MNHPSELASLKDAVYLLRKYQERIRDYEDAAHEPIAIVGVGCRFPGGCESPGGYWKLLREGVDAIEEVPAERWDVDEYYDRDPSAPGKMTTRWGGFLKDVDLFDPEFFGISPREAVRMDPQHRLLLEVTWEALEHAGMPPTELAGSRSGVFVGFVNTDYQALVASQFDDVDIFSASGCATSVLANRISYALNLQGPSLALDTACSSSLVTLHLACQSLRRGESDLALAGGVNLTLLPEVSIVLSKAQMLSPNGRCRTFSSAADGYVRGEGCGMLVLKRLSDARRSGDRIFAVVRGSAVNHGGRGNGLSAPNSVQQEAVIRAALADARLEPNDIDYLEAHGTGTKLGDPVEFEALMSVFGGDRPSDRPLIVGSVKTNIGHLESAAGIAGVVKTVLALQHEEIPAHLHFEEPNSLLNLDASPAVVPTSLTKWLKNGKPRRAGVSSFGFGGMNAHAIIEEAPEEAVSSSVSPCQRPRHLLSLSARNEQALIDLAARYAEVLDANPDTSLADFAYSANTGRATLTHRLAVTAETTDQLKASLRAFSDGSEASSLLSRECGPGERLKVAFLFTGQGAQYAGMASALYETLPSFRQTMNECAAITDRFLDRPLLSLLEPESHDEINQTGFTQPAMFAVEYSLAQLWRSWGIEPAVVMGHSVGELAAACVAGVMSLEDGLRLIARRAQLMQSLPAEGKMAAIFADEATVEGTLLDASDQVGIAALNGPQNTVISGASAAVEAMLERFKAQGIKTQILTTSHAFHSHLMNPILEELDEFARHINFSSPSIPVISNLSGNLADGTTYADSAYWSDHARLPVKFASGVRTAGEMGCNAFIEIGPQPVLIGMGQRCVGDHSGLWLPSLREGRDEWQTLLGSLAQVFIHGGKVDWKSFDRDYVRQRMDVPTYPFQRKRFWVDGKSQWGSSQNTAGDAHPLLGNRLASPIADRIYEARVNASNPPMLSHHKVQDTVVVPGAAHVELALAAAAAVDGKSWTVENIAMLAPLVLSKRPQTIQTIVSPERPGLASFRIVSVNIGDGAEDSTYVTHSAGQLRAARADNAASSTVDVAKTKLRFAGDPFDAAWRREKAENVGLQYGHQFSWVEKNWLNGDEAFGEFRAPTDEDRSDSYKLHPGLLDTMFQLLGTTLHDKIEAKSAFVPLNIERVQLVRPPVGRMWGIAKLNSLDDKLAVGDVRLYDDEGQLIAECVGLQLRRVANDWLRRVVAGPQPHWLYELAWTEQAIVPRADQLSQAWLLYDNANGVGEHVAEGLRRAGHVCEVVPFSSEDASAEYALRAFLKAPGDLQRSIVHLSATSIKGSGEQAFDASREQGWGSVLNVVKQVVTSGVTPTPRLWLVTQGSQRIRENANGESSSNMALAQSPVWGLGRVVAVEHPELECKLLDLDASANDLAQTLTTELTSDTRETQIAYRNGKRYVARLRSTENGNVLRTPQDEPYRMEIKKRGELDQVELRPTVRFRPGPGQIEIKVKATGLNFRDVLNVLDLYPGDPGPLGGECAGEVVAVGPGVQDFKPGDEVLALAPASFSTYATTLACFAVRKPTQLKYEQAAGLPIAFATVHYALRKLGNIRKGSRVLIHSATGGVGLAAIQVARDAGATIFATAGTETKRQYLREMGIEHVMDSRSLEFGEQVMSLTSGEGVDMVLNTLTGDAIEKGILVLAPNGHFLELGKTDLWDQQRVSVIHPTAVFHAIALDHMMADEPDVVSELLREVIGEIAEGSLQPLPTHSFPIAHAIDAFRHMARAEHIGKVAIQAASDQDDESLSFELSDQGSYLVTGGLGGLGLKTTQWLTSRGVKSIVLVGRSTPTTKALTAIKQLSDLGISVTVKQCDISDRDQVASLISEIDRELLPLRGVVHLAGVLDDGIIRDQTRERFDRVLGAKMYGAWHLHELTKERSLDLFVLFSSAACLLGSPGQANYAAANCFLDALAHERRRQNLPALSVNWGNWAEVGMAAKLEASEGKRWESMGVGWIPLNRGFELLEELLVDGRAQAGVLPFDWSKFFSKIPAGSEPLWLSELASKARSQRAASGPPELLDLLADTKEEEQFDVVLAYVRKQAARVVAMEDGLPDERRLLNELGFDSLTAVEFCNAIGRSIDQHLNPMILFDYPTLEALACHVSRDLLKIQLPEEYGRRLAAQQQVRDELSQQKEMLEDIEGMTSDDMEALINAQLAKLNDAA